MNTVPTPPLEDGSEQRSRRRELIRAYHPDRGGDPAVFIEMLRSMGQDGVDGPAVTEIRFAKRHQRWRHQRWRLRRPRRPLRRHQPRRVS